jgi:hypothetical protein
MSNQLKMATIQLILALRAQRWSFRRISTEVGIHRDTVARYVHQAESKPAKAPPGSVTLEAAAAAAAATGSTALPPPVGRSHCEPWREQILAKLNQGLSAERIKQDLSAESTFTASYYSVRRFVNRLSGSTPLPYRRMECGPGDEGQADFGQGAPVITAEGILHGDTLCPISYSPKRAKRIPARRWAAAAGVCRSELWNRAPSLES